MRSIIHILVFVVGLGVGVVWGVHHPQAAENVDLRIEKEVAQAKLDLLNRFKNDDPKAAANYQQDVNDAQSKLDEANKALNNQ
ncbi:MAG: hypothetical protein ABSF29_01275 [Tepidisphaeraceae bacterium]|jgi:hypothetical protein